MKYLVLTSLIWSFSFGIIKSQLTGLDPNLVAFIRLGLSCLLFLPFLKAHSKPKAGALATLGFVQFGLMYCLYIAAYAYLKSYEVALLTITTPIFVVLVEGLRQRRFIGRFWLAAVLAVGASLFPLLDKASQIDGLPVIKGILLIQAANLCFAIGQVWYKDIAPVTTKNQEHFAWLYLGALLAPILLMTFQGFEGVQWPTRSQQWLSLLYLGLIPSGLCFFLWNKGVTLVNTGTVAVMNNLKQPLGVFVSWLVFAEVVDPGGLSLATVLFALSLWLVYKSQDRQRDRTV